MCLSLFRTYPKAGGLKAMSNMCTTGASTGVRTRIDTTIKPDTVGPDHAAYLWAAIPSGNYGLMAVTIVYTSDL
ncbi:MAG: hypothetical protein KJ698_09470 [Actinobacteria bacterium]|nr:hypothetical protein [Actinomycetota bacterium]MBU1494349.1 hypothetical protein [Actinomycetota bacterium]